MTNVMPIENANRLIDILSDTNNYYLNSKAGNLITLESSELEMSDFVLYKVDSVTFKKDAPRREALENVLSALRIEGINFVYLVLGTKEGTEFYYGITRDYSKEAPDLNIHEIGQSILEPSIKGNFRGSNIDEIRGQNKRDVLTKIRQSAHNSIIEGVPGILEQEDEFQGVDRLADVMSNDSEFGFMIISSLVSDADLDRMKSEIFSIYSWFSPLSKQSIQLTHGINQGTNTSDTTGENESTSEGTTTGESISDTLSNNSSHTTSTNESESVGTNNSASKGLTDSKNESNTLSKNESHTQGKSTSNTTGESKNFSKGTNENFSIGTNNSKNVSDTVSNGSSTSHTTGKNSGRTDTDSYGGGDSRATTTGSSTSNTTGKNQGTSHQTGSSSGTSETKSKGTNTNQSIGTNTSKTDGKNVSDTIGSGESKTIGYAKTTSMTITDGKSKTKTTGTSDSITEGTGTSHTTSTNTGTSLTNTKGTNTSTTTGSSEGKSIGHASTVEQIDKRAQDWMKYIDDILLPRIDYGSGKGMFMTGMLCFANSKAVLKKLQNTIISLFSGETGNKIPLRAFLLEDGRRLDAFRNLQLPRVEIKAERSAVKSLLSQNDKFGSLLSSKELSLITGLPKKDVIGLELREEVEFGLNFKSFKNQLELGKLVQSGNITEKTVGIDKDALDKHIFITGVTGSGKTTTCLNILENSNLPFLVIEPAKTEYRILKKKYPELLIFTLGNDTLAPFRLNPFEFFPHESITSRVDMIKASIEAAFDMEAAIPQIIESAIYECYKDKGWNIATNKNIIYGDKAFDAGVYSFPTLSDLMEKVTTVVKDQGFDDRLRDEYIGSIKARLNGLIVGSKGFMLNTKRSIDFKQLINQKVVFELEEIRNGSEKSLVMGFILTHLLEAIKSNFEERKRHGVNHIILIEEAHRLLSKYQPGDSMNKKQGVEVFTDMLAEIRKYGECLMIADQIPNKLAPEVLKNTNTKIVHRIFAADDKEAIGNTMALEEEQSDFLSKLDAGRAILFSGGFNKSVAVQINQSSNTTNEIVDKTLIYNAALEFYAKNARSGAILGSNLLENVDSKTIANLLDFQRNGAEEVMKKISGFGKAQKIDKNAQAFLQEFEYFGLDFLAKIYLMYKKKYSEEKIPLVKEFIQKYIANEKIDANEYKKEDIF
ncbi:helicase HerA domain-containing protein [Campylobacter devanensis]|uniref:helicase HerA domain-containing protein n=1 Tax=Campylobacter devanensis TaxID=3161138 RepID=UPI000A350906|nr:DUF87 domain-containing protein [Campylobacter sp. P0132]